MRGIDVEDLLPSPIKMVINASADEFYMYNGDGFDEVLNEHNKNHDEKIKEVFVLFVDGLEQPYLLEPNYYEIYVGEDNILSGYMPDAESYENVSKLIQFVLDSYHDQIIEAQHQLEKLLEDYEMDNFDELLYSYYRIHDNKRTFYFLKRLAEKYPASYYVNTLRRVYATGLNKMHPRNPALARKIRDKKRGFDKNFHN